MCPAEELDLPAMPWPGGRFIGASDVMADCIVTVDSRTSDGGTLVGFDNGSLVGLVTSASAGFEIAGVLWPPHRSAGESARFGPRCRSVPAAGMCSAAARRTTLPLLECLHRLPTPITVSLPPESAAFDPGGAGSRSTAS
jgi:hypothetical protein